MSIKDIDVTDRALDIALVTAPAERCDQACDMTAAPFDGLELLHLVLDYPPGTTWLTVQADATGIDVAEAMRGRGNAAVNAAGRVGITLGPGRVLEPFGRAYAISTGGPQRWTSGWRLGAVTRTMR